MKAKIAIFLVILVGCSQMLLAMSADSLLNVVYGKGKTLTGNEQTLNMDLFFPNREAGKKYPLVLMMHGGSFATGTKEIMKSHCQILADSGFIAVSINYRKGWDRGENKAGCEGNLIELREAVYRATQDANAALRFLVNKQREYAIDTSWIFVGGISAGGVMALNVAYLKQDNLAQLFPDAEKELGGLNSTSNNIRQPFTIKGICNMWGALPDSSLVTAKNAVPTIFFHGKDDVVVPYDSGRFGSACPEYPMMYGSACIYRRTVAAGKPAILNIAKGANHGPKEFSGKVTMSNTACFFKHIMQGTASGGQVFDKAKPGCR